MAAAAVTILKVIFFLLLFFLALVLAALFTVLLVPVRWRARGAFKENRPDCSVRVTWLLRAISLTAVYEKDLAVDLRILFFYPLRRKKDPETGAGGGRERKGGGGKTGASAGASKAGAAARAALPAEKSGQAEYTPGKMSAKAEHTTRMMPAGEEHTSGSKPAEADGSGDAGAQKEKAAPSLLKRAAAELRKLSEKPAHIPGIVKDRMEALARVPETVQGRLLSVKDRLDSLRKKKDGILALIRDPENQKTFSHILRLGKQLLLHLRPTRLTGRLVFGFSDPYTTGQVLMYVSPFIAFYGKSFSLVPVFDTQEQVFEGELAAEGRVRLGTLLILGVRLFMDRNFRKLLKKHRRRRRRTEYA